MIREIGVRCSDCGGVVIGVIDDDETRLVGDLLDLFCVQSLNVTRVAKKTTNEGFVCSFYHIEFITMAEPDEVWRWAVKRSIQQSRQL